MTSDQRTDQANSFDLVLFLWARRKLIIWITLAGLVAGVAAAFIITPLFKSEVILFPAITNSASKALLNEQSTGRDDILALGDEEDAEQLLQVLNSDLVRDRTSGRFDLMKAYHIRSDSKTRNTELREAFREHITFEYTKFGSVRVEVLHHQPDTAALIANFIAAQVDSVWKDMNYERAYKGLQLVQLKVTELETEIELIEDSMKVLRGLGVHDYHTQTERYNEYMGAAILKGDQRAIKEFDERFKVLAQYGGTYVTLQDRQYNEVKRLSIMQMKLEQAQADFESDLPHKFIVNEAQVADKKSYPVRWLVVAISGVSALLFALLLIIVQENVRKIARPMPTEFTFRQYFQELRARWKFFAVVALVAIVLSTVFSGPGFIAPRYRSMAILYPANLTPYSVETRTDQLMQLLGSNSIRDSLLKKFDLARHFRVDTTRTGGHARLYNEFADRVEVSKTRYESVQVEVVDENPAMARNIVQGMLDQANLLARRLQREKSAEVLAIAVRTMKHAKFKMDSAEARLKVLREQNGLLVYESQTKELTKGYVSMITRPGATQAQKDEVRSMMKQLQEQGGEFRGLTDLSDMFRQNYNESLLAHEQAVNDMTKELTYIHMVVYPEQSDKKVFPIRWLIVLLSTVSAVFLAFIFTLWRKQA